MVARSLLKEPKYWTKEQLLHETPSRRDGVDAATEAKVRKTYCRLIDAAGRKLKMPQWAIATATVFCHRFYALKSLKKNDRFLIPTACLFLAGKIDDSPRALQDVLVFCWEQKNKHKPEEIQKLRNPAFLAELRELVLAAERCILYTRGFDLYIDHPYGPLTNILKTHQLLPDCFQSGDTRRNLLQACWNFVNDSLKTDLCLRYSPSVIAKAIIWLTAKLLKLEDLPVDLDKKAFAEVFEVKESDLESICHEVMDMYTFTDGSGKTTVIKSGANNCLGVDSFSPLSMAAQDTTEAEAKTEVAAQVVIKTEETCVQVGVGKDVPNSIKGEVKQELIRSGDSALLPAKQNGMAKKRKAMDDGADVPECKSVKVEG